MATRSVAMSLILCANADTHSHALRGHATQSAALPVDNHRNLARMYHIGAAILRT